jgi:citronellol/citronellal dehydrogenase
MLSTPESPQADSDPAVFEVLRGSVLASQTVLVTGAGTGIGRATARRLAGLGAYVVGIGRHAETLATTGEGLADGSYEFAVVDVRDSEKAAAAIRLIGERRGLTALINNAGGQFIAPAESISRRGWDAVIDLNLNAVFELTKAAYPYLRRDGGSVVNISLSGVERGSMGMAHSVAARAGVLGLTRTLALEWAKDRVRLNCIGPGTVVTANLGTKYGPEAVQNFLKATPLGRATAPEQVAELIGFLLSPAGELISGQLLQMDGAGSLGAGFHGLDGTS